MGRKRRTAERRNGARGWNTPIDPSDLSLNDLAMLGSAAAYVAERHGDEFRDFIRARTGDDISPERLAAASRRAKSAWDKQYWATIVPAYMDAAARGNDPGAP